MVSARALIHVKDQPYSRAPKRRSLLPTGVDSLPSGKRTELFLSRREITAPGGTPFSVRNLCTGIRSACGQGNKYFDKRRCKFLRNVRKREKAIAVDDEINKRINILRSLLSNIGKFAGSSLARAHD